MDEPGTNRAGRRGRPPRVPLMDRGTGAPIVLLHGYALTPWTYERTITLLSRRARVLVPRWQEVDGRWRADRVLCAIEAVEGRVAGPWTVVAHSFGGALGLSLAARRPDLVTTLVLSDSIALSKRWPLARMALPGADFLRLATYRAAVDFLRSWGSHPATLTRAAWWGFATRRHDEIQRVRQAGVDSHVLWAERDTLLSRDDGRRFADDLGATFSVVSDPEGAGPVDHNWMFRHPELFVRVIDALRLPCAAEAPPAAGPETRRGR